MELANFTENQLHSFVWRKEITLNCHRTSWLVWCWWMTEQLAPLLSLHLDLDQSFNVPETVSTRSTSYFTGSFLITIKSLARRDGEGNENKETNSSSG